MNDSATIGVITPDDLDETAARIRLITMTRGERPGCPSCGIEFDEPRRGRLYAGKYVVCSCGVKSGAFSGTLFNGTTLDPQDLLYLLDRLTLDVPPAVIAMMTKAGCTPGTVYNWRNRLTAAGML